MTGAHHLPGISLDLGSAGCARMPQRLLGRR
jgi:hypothetical protein